MASVNPDLKGLDLPSEHQYVVIDTSIELPKYKNIAHIPMTFWIDYTRVDRGMSNPSPLTLLINPNNMTIAFVKKIQPSFARGGFIVEEWGEEQTSLECEGKIGGYYITTSSVRNAPDSVNGLNRYNRSKSLSFKNLHKLSLIYRNNGAIYQNTVKTSVQNKLIQKAGYPRINDRIPLVLQSQKNRIDRVGDVYLGYDNTIYRGSFDSFSMTEDANSPYTLSYKFKFTVQNKTIKDNRDHQYFFQNTIENADVSKNIEEINRVIRNAINVGKDASAGGLFNQNLLETNVSAINLIKHTTKPDIPLPSEDLISPVSSDGLAQKAKQDMYNNNVNMNQEEVGKIKEGFGKVIEAKDKKIYELEETGKKEIKDSLKESAIRNGKSERQASNLSENLSQNLINEINPRKNPSFERRDDLEIQS